MSKHRKQQNTTARRIAAASVVAAGSTLVVPGVADAAPAPTIDDVVAQIPGASDIPGIDALKEVRDVEGLQQWATDVASSEVSNYLGQAAPAQVANVVADPAPSSVSENQQAVDIAHTKIGSPYAWGGSGPDAFDCSGLTSWVFSQVGKSIPRTSQAQMAGGTPVSYNDLQPGDIVGFYSGNTHVGIYIGGGQIIDALNSSTPVAIHSLDMMPFNGAVRY